VLGSLFIGLGREIYAKDEQRNRMEEGDSDEDTDIILDHQRTEAARKVGRRVI
jgi:hypothetical protein